ncbi:MAG: hypothetical protein KF764_28945 [Labilithrix sp.]|nr:hypothetical protein [Labilithrix sp.]
MSTPWIVFDRDSRVDDFAKSALRVGAVFASTPSFRPEILEAAAKSGLSVAEQAAQPVIVTGSADVPPAAPAAPAEADPFRPGAVLAPAMSSVLPSAGVFPPSVGSPESVVEPSNLIVAADVMPDSSSSIALDDARAPFASASFPVVPAFIHGRGRLAAIAGACAGVVAVASIAAVVLAGAARSQEKVAAASNVELPTAAAAAVAAPPPAEAAAIAEAPAPPAAEATTTKAASEPEAAKAPVDPKQRFGKLTIKAEAKRKNVWFDGKRMLGSGQRSFLVFCGMHTVAVSDKTDTKDIEVPCNGEYVVSK